MIDRIPSGFHPFVLPFVIGMAFVLGYCLLACLRIILQLEKDDRKRLFISLVTPTTIYKNIRDILCDCLLHVKLWRRNKLLGYMHSSIAFGWFMLILLGHIEVFLFVPGRINLFYYPIFFNYFVAQDEVTLKGSLIFFLMDFFLLVVLSGIGLAILKRGYSRLFGMRRTPRPSIPNMIGLYSLWAIFPLRLLAETFTAHISGGSFLTNPANQVFRYLLGNDLDIHTAWWMYSIALGIFMVVLPFSRYMHIPAEMLLIPLRNAGLRVQNAYKGIGRVEVFSCPNCGVCIDACPMSVSRANVKDCTIYLTRQIRRHNDKRVQEISDKCLLCGKCEALCQVGVEGPELRIREREKRQYAFHQNYSNIIPEKIRQAKVIYFAGCMSRLTPSIPMHIESVLKKAGIDFVRMDQDGGICCGRPLMTAGRTAEALELVRINENIIRDIKANILVVNCPICYKMFIETYQLGDVQVLHHTQFFNLLLQQHILKVEKSALTYVYHDPCELGRGCGEYEQPRQLLSLTAGIAEATKNRKESICCGGSLGSLSLNYKDREKITKAALENLYESHADAIATACPLCQNTFAHYADRPVRDLAEILDKAIINENKLNEI